MTFCVVWFGLYMYIHEEGCCLLVDSGGSCITYAQFGRVLCKACTLASP